jgi:hypothetical protein
MDLAARLRLATREWGIGAQDLRGGCRWAGVGLGGGEAVLEALSGLVTFGLMALSFVIGVRLVRLGRRAGGPELWLGLYFLVYGCFATSASVTVYLGWSAPDVAFSDATTRLLNAAFYGLSTIGMTCLLLFTQRTFRPGSSGARVLVWSNCAVLVGAAIGVGVTEGFEVRVLNGAFYWIAYLARLAPFVWVSVESFRYGAMLRRRVSIGLADPLVADRFLLWGLWSAVLAVMAFSDPLARFWYWHLSGSTTQWVGSIGRPIIDVVVPLSSAFGIAAVTLLFLTFFPTPAYRRWVARRSATTAAG